MVDSITSSRALRTAVESCAIKIPLGANRDLPALAGIGEQVEALFLGRLNAVVAGRCRWIGSEGDVNRLVRLNADEARGWVEGGTLRRRSRCCDRRLSNDLQAG